MKSRTKRSSCKINEPAGVPSRVTDEGYATSEYISCALRMHESIYSTTRSCGEPLLNRAAFSFRSPFMGRNLRSLKRRHGTTRADLYTARLPPTIILFLPLPLFLSLLSPLSAYLFFRPVSRYAFRFMGILRSENIQPMSFRDVEAKRLSHICILQTAFPPSRASIVGTFRMTCL